MRNTGDKLCFGDLPLAEAAPLEVELHAEVDPGAGDGVESAAGNERLLQELMFLHVPGVGGLLLPGHLEPVLRQPVGVELLGESVAEGGEKVKVGGAGRENSHRHSSAVARLENSHVLAALPDPGGVERPGDLGPVLDAPGARVVLAHPEKIWRCRVKDE